MENDVFISVKDLENGFENIPKISERTQKNLRKSKAIKYTKIGRNIYYKRSWLLEYIKSNTVEKD